MSRRPGDHRCAPIDPRGNRGVQIFGNSRAAFSGDGRHPCGSRPRATILLRLKPLRSPGNSEIFCLGLRFRPRDSGIRPSGKITLSPVKYEFGRPRASLHGSVRANFYRTGVWPMPSEIEPLASPRMARSNCGEEATVLGISFWRKTAAPSGSHYLHGDLEWMLVWENLHPSCL